MNPLITSVLIILIATVIMLVLRLSALTLWLMFPLGRGELPAIINVLRTQEKADLVILISHLGFPQDMKLLSEVPGIDVCLSGHTHNRLYKPALQGETLIIQSGSHGSFLGRLDLEIEEDVLLTTGTN